MVFINKFLPFLNLQAYNLISFFKFLIYVSLFTFEDIAVRGAKYSLWWLKLWKDIKAGISLKY